MKFDTAKFGTSLIFFVVMTLTGLLIHHFYNVGWYPQDAGAFIHVAERMADATVGTENVDDVHPGYLNFINAWALKQFGKDFVSLNYPLMAVVLIESAVLFLFFIPVGNVTAFIAAFIPSILGVFQFINPNHHWYALFLSILLACLLTQPPKEGNGRRFFAGVLIASIFLFRQLTGVFMAIGVLSFFLFEGRIINQPVTDKKQWFAPCLLLFMSFALIFYYLRVTNFTGFVLFGLGPLTLLWLGRITVQVPNQNVKEILFQFLSGIGFGFIPIIAYHFLHNDLFQWSQNTFFLSLSVLNQSFLTGDDYFRIIFCGFYESLHPDSWTIFLNGIFWLILPLLPVLNLIILIRRLKEIPAVKPHTIAIPFLAVFYGLVALHYQIPAYLFFSVGFSILGILWMSSGSSPIHRGFLLGTTLFLLGVGLYFHAGQSLNRFFLLGEKSPLVFAGTQIPRLSLWVDSNDLIIYREMITFIDQATKPDDYIFVVPNDAELYFLANRKNPFRFFSTDHGIQNAARMEEVIGTIKRNPPRLIIDRPEDKRHTIWSKGIMEFVAKNYTFIRTIGPFKFYQSRTDLPES